MNKNTSPILAVTALATCLFTLGCEYEDDSEADLDAELEAEPEAAPETLTEEGDENIPVDEHQGVVVAQLTIADSPEGNGPSTTRLEIIELPSEDGESTFGVMEIGNGGISLDDIAQLSDTDNLREVFHAFATPEQSEPEALAAAFPEPALGPRGWAQQEIAAGNLHATRSSICNYNNFTSEFDAWHSEINGDMYRYADENAYSYTSTTCYTQTSEGLTTTWASNGRTSAWNVCDSSQRAYSHYNVDKYKSYVAACDLSGSDRYQYNLAFRYRRAGNSSTGVAWSSEIDGIDDEGKSWRWYWVGNNSSEANNDWDWVSLMWGQAFRSHSPRSPDSFHIATRNKHMGW